MRAPSWLALAAALAPLASSAPLRTAAAAESAKTDRKLGWVSVEFDPITTPLGARNLLVYLEPPALPHASFGAVAFASDFPGWVDDLMGYRNRGEGFDLRVRPSPGVVADWYLGEDRAGWHVGAFAFYWRYEAARGGDVARFQNLIAMPRVGYRWFPFDRLPVYLDPFVGAMFEARAGGESDLDGSRVRPSPVLPFATIHLGLHF